jgi:hypothetical protein
MCQNYPFPYNPSARTEFHDSSCQVTAYPSVGGFVFGFFSAVELAYLDLSRSGPSNRSSDTAEEDRLALRMLHLGAHWWPSGSLYARHKEQIDQRIPYEFHVPPEVKVGCPSSGNGLWVLKFLVDSNSWYEADDWQPSIRRRPEDWGIRMNYVLTMDEQCEALRKLGAVFYEKLEDCEEIPETLDQAVQSGKHYEKLLKKMEDPEYLDKWLDGPPWE